MSNILKTVTDTTTGSMEVEYETDTVLSNCPNSRSSKLEVKYLKISGRYDVGVNRR